MNIAEFAGEVFERDDVVTLNLNRAAADLLAETIERSKRYSDGRGLFIDGLAADIRTVTP